MKYILYTQILQDIIFNDTFQIPISQILYQYTKLHINATLGIKTNTQLNFTNLKDNSIQFELNQKKNHCKVITNNFLISN